MKKVSVIVPTYNNEKYIGRCINSILNQSYHNIEIIIINDGSSDRTEKVLETLVKDKNNIVLKTQENKGVSIARNLGIRIATGEYITFVDGDDYIAKDYIKNLVLKLEEDDADFVLGGVNFVKSDGKIVKKLIPDKYIRFYKEEWLCKISGIWSHLYKRDLWNRYKVQFGADVRGEDMPIALLFSAICSRISIVPEADYYYVQHDNSAMKHFRGLKTYKLPYDALDKTFYTVQQIGVKNSFEFYEMFAFRIFATFIFLSKGASQKEKKKLCDYIVREVNKYFPDYSRNSKMKLLSPVEVPFWQKIFLFFLICAIKYNKLYLMIKYY